MELHALLFTMAFSYSALAQMPEWSYDAGPEMGDKPCHEQSFNERTMGCELIDLTADIPNFPMISNKIIGRKQKFRPAFGPIPWRMRLDKNKVKILFMGQDGTHIAEAAGRPATAGFGGRAQDFANYFGVNEGAAFINAYSFTIKGQYGVYNTPYMYQARNGKTSIRTSNHVDNNLWLISQDLSSPIVQWRNDLIDWIIRNNKDSMKLIVLFGGAARDSIATFAKSKGAIVGTRLDGQEDQIQVPVTKEEYAGGNNTFPSLRTKEGKDLYEKILGRKLDYKNSKDQKAAVAALKENLEELLANDEIALTEGGVGKTGLLSLAQLSGFDLDKMKVNGITTRSLKGLKLNDGTYIENDILVVSLPHPSSLSRTVMDADSYAQGLEAASKRVMRDVKVLNKYKEAGWEIEADSGKTNFYHEGENYRYGRSDIGPEFYDFGTPKNRMVSKSTARRMSRNANVVIIGTRDNGKFSSSEIRKMTNAKAAFGINPNQMFIARPSVMEERYVFDPGPGEELAKIMVTNLDEDAVFQTKIKLECLEAGKVVKVIESTNEKLLQCKEGQESESREMSFEQDGIAAYNVKTHPSVDDFGHYRGKFDNPKVVILADPIGYDDIVTARALTGTRGQYLHGLMEDIGVKDNYLVVKTMPYGMDGTTADEQAEVLKVTETYRKKLAAAILERGTPDFVIADGKMASAVVDELFKGTKIIKTQREFNNLNADFKYLVKEIKQVKGYEDVKSQGRMAYIPRSHLTFYARVWEGTSGDRVITSAGKKYEGIAFAEVVPKWAYDQELNLVEKNENAIDSMIQILRDAGLPLPYQSLSNFFERVD